MEKESFEGDRADWKRHADNEIKKITKRIDEHLSFESVDPNVNKTRDLIRSEFSEALKTFEENICSSIRKSTHKFYFEKDLYELLAEFDDIDDDAEMLCEENRRKAVYRDARKEINAAKAKLRETEAEAKLDKYIRRFNKAINYKPCSYNHEINLKKCIVMNEQEMDAYKNRTQHLINKELNDQEFAEQLELIESSLLEMIAIAKNYRRLTGVTFSLMTPAEKKKHAEDELNAHIQQFNKVINYRPCSFTHDSERNQCLKNYDWQVIECRETIEFLIDKPIKFKQFDKELRELFSPIVDNVNTAEKYRLLNDITHSKQMTKTKGNPDLLNRAKITIDSIKERFDVELNVIENPVLEELNKPFEDARKSVENKIAAHREKLKLDIMSMDDEAVIAANLKECVDALECDLKKLQEELQPFRDYQKEIFPIRERAENNCVQLIKRADNLKHLIINRDSEDVRELNSKCHTGYYTKKVECAIRDHYKQTIDTKQLQVKLKELNDELNEIIGKAEHSLSTQSYAELHQKLEEIKTQFNNRLVLEPIVKRRSLNVAKLSNKFNNDLRSVLKDIEMKSLVARSTSDFMTEVLQPFRSMVTEAEDLVLPHVNQQIEEKKNELITQFNKTLDFKSGDKRLMAKRATLRFKFKKMLQSPFKQVSLDLDDLGAISTSNYTTKVLQPLISLVQKAEDLRDKHGDALLSQMEQGLSAKFTELKTNFHNSLDFDSGNEDICVRRNELHSQFLKASEAYVANDDEISEEELIGGSVSDMVTKTLEPFIILVDQADNLRREYNNFVKLQQKLEEIKKKLYATIDFKTNDNNLYLRNLKLRVKFEKAANTALSVKLKELHAKTDSDYMDQLLKPFTRMMKEAEDLRDKCGDELLSRMEQELSAKFTELKTNFDNSLDFECGDQNLIERRRELQSQFLKASEAYVANDDEISEEELITGSVSDMVTKTLEPFIILVDQADNLRREYNNFVKLQQKLEEIKKKLYATIDFKTNDNNLYLRKLKLRVKFEKAAYTALAVKLKELHGKTDSDYMDQLLKPFTRMMKEAEDLRDKCGDELLSRMEQELSAKFTELKTNFDNSLDFECDDQNIIERRRELQSQFLEASKAYVENDDEISEEELIARPVADMVTETLERFIFLVDKAEELRDEFEFAKSQLRENVHQKLEELKKELNTFLDFKTNDSSLSLSMSNLRVKFEDASSAALKAFERNLVTKTGSDYMEGLLQPFRSMVQEADDLRDKHGDALLSQMEQELDAKYKELKTKFHNTLDFESDDQNIIGRRNELHSQFLEASRTYLDDDDEINQEELIAGSVSDMVTLTLARLIGLVDDAEDLRQEHEGN